MSRRLLRRVLAIPIGAFLFTGMFTIGAGTPARVVEAAVDASLSADLKEAFDADFYSNKYEDVKKLYGKKSDALFDHFINNGIYEGRMINSGFDPKAYMQAYADVKLYCNGDYSKAYEHYFKYGKAEGRKLTTFAAISAQNYLAPQTAPSQSSGNNSSGDSGSSSQKVDIGYGMTAVLTADQINDAEIRVYQSDYGYGAYLVDANGNETLIASTSYYAPWEEKDYVSTVEVSVKNNSDITTAPVAGTDIVTYYNVGLDELTNSYNHYSNGPDLNLVPGSTSESVDWDGDGNTPYILQFGFGEYNPVYVETGVSAYSPETGHIDTTETSIWTDVPWSDYLK